MTSRTDARVRAEGQLRAQRFDQVHELQHQHRHVLSRYPSAQFLLPDPHDSHPSRDPWQRRVHGAHTLLVSLEAPNAHRLRDDARRVYAEILEEEEDLIDELPENMSFEHNPSAWINTFLEKLRLIDRSGKGRQQNCA